MREWISALRSSQIRQLVEARTLCESLFDQHNLAEISSPDFPGERLIACRNPLLADLATLVRNTIQPNLADAPTWEQETEAKSWTLFV